MNIFCFSNVSSVWKFLLPEAVVLDSLQNDGNSIYYINCLEYFDNYEFTNLSAYGLDNHNSLSERHKVFKQAKINYNLIKEKYNFNFLNYEDFVNQQKFTYLNETILQSITQKNYINFEINGIHLGKIALSDIILKYKIYDLDNFQFTETIWEEYKLILLNCIKVYYLANEVFNKINFDRVIMYITGYSINLVIKKIAKQRNIPVYQIVGSRNWSKVHDTIQLSLDDGPIYSKCLIKQWEEIKNDVIHKTDINEVFNHFNTLLSSNHALVYSKSLTESVDIYEYFNIHKDKKILFAAMSSMDEWFSYHLIASDDRLDIKSDNVFNTQIEWIEALFEYMKNRQDIHLIIRVHPREFPNKREKILSEHAKVLMTKFSSLDSNISVNWPEDNLSFYNFIDYIDVGLVSHSSTGMEIPVYGIPCVSYNSNFLTFPSALHYSSNSKREFFEAIDSALNEGWSIENTIKALKWFSVFLSKAVISLESAFSFKLYDNRNFIEKVSDKLIAGNREKRHINTVTKLDEENIVKICQTIKNNRCTPYNLSLMLSNSDKINELSILKNQINKFLDNFSVKSKNLKRLKNWTISD